MIMNRVGEVLVLLGSSHTSLQLIVVSLHLYEFLLMVLLHLHNTGLELLESVVAWHRC